MAALLRRLGFKRLRFEDLRSGRTSKFGKARRDLDLEPKRLSFETAGFGGVVLHFAWESSTSLGCRGFGFGVALRVSGLGWRESGMTVLSLEGAPGFDYCSSSFGRPQDWLVLCDFLFGVASPENCRGVGYSLERCLRGVLGGRVVGLRSPRAKKHDVGHG